MADWNDWQDDWDAAPSSGVKEKSTPRKNAAENKRDSVSVASSKSDADWNNDWNNNWDDTPQSSGTAKKEQPVRVPRKAPTSQKKKPTGRTLLSKTENVPVVENRDEENRRHESDSVISKHPESEEDSRRNTHPDLQPERNGQDTIVTKPPEVRDIIDHQPASFHVEQTSPDNRNGIHDSDVCDSTRNALTEPTEPAQIVADAVHSPVLEVVPVPDARTLQIQKKAQKKAEALLRKQKEKEKKEQEVQNSRVEESSVQPALSVSDELVDHQKETQKNGHHHETPTEVPAEQSQTEVVHPQSETVDSDITQSQQTMLDHAGWEWNEGQASEVTESNRPGDHHVTRSHSPTALPPTETTAFEESVIQSEKESASHQEESPEQKRQRILQALAAEANQYSSEDEPIAFESQQEQPEHSADSHEIDAESPTQSFVPTFPNVEESPASPEDVSKADVLKETTNADAADWGWHDEEWDRNESQSQTAVEVEADAQPFIEDSIPLNDAESIGPTESGSVSIFAGPVTDREENREEHESLPKSFAEETIFSSYERPESPEPFTSPAVDDRQDSAVPAEDEAARDATESPIEEEVAIQFEVSIPESADESDISPPVTDLDRKLDGSPPDELDQEVAMLAGEDVVPSTGWRWDGHRGEQHGRESEDQTPLEGLREGVAVEILDTAEIVPVERVYLDDGKAEMWGPELFSQQSRESAGIENFGFEDEGAFIDPRTSTFVENAEMTHFSGFKNGVQRISLSPLRSASNSEIDEDDTPVEHNGHSFGEEPIYFEARRISEEHPLGVDQSADTNGRSRSNTTSSSSEENGTWPKSNKALQNGDYEQHSVSDYRGGRNASDRSSRRSSRRSQSGRHSSGSYSYDDEEDYGESEYSRETAGSAETSWTVTDPMEKIMRAFGPIAGLAGHQLGMPLSSSTPAFPSAFPPIGMGIGGMGSSFMDPYANAQRFSMMPDFFPSNLPVENTAETAEVSTPHVAKHLYPYSTGTFGVGELIRIDNFSPPIALESCEASTRLNMRSVYLSKFPHDLSVHRPDIDDKLSTFCRYMADNVSDSNSLDSGKREESLLWSLLSLLVRYGANVRNFAVSEVLMGASRDPGINMSAASIVSLQNPPEGYPGEKRLAAIRRSLAAGLVPRACRAAEEAGRTPLSFMLLSLPSVIKTNNKSALEGFQRYLEKTISPSDPIFTACSLMCNGSPKLSECVKNWTIHVAVVVGCGVLIPSSSKTKFLLTLADMMESCGKYFARDVLYLLSRPAARLSQGRSGVMIGTNVNAVENLPSGQLLNDHLNRILLTEAYVYVANKLNPAVKSTVPPSAQYSYLCHVLDAGMTKEGMDYFNYFLHGFISTSAEASEIDSVLLLTVFEQFAAYEGLMSRTGHALLNWKPILFERISKCLERQKQRGLENREKEARRLLERKLAAEARQLEMEHQRREAEWRQREQEFHTEYEANNRHYTNESFENHDAHFVQRSSRTSSVNQHHIADGHFIDFPVQNHPEGGHKEGKADERRESILSVTVEEQGPHDETISFAPPPAHDEQEVQRNSGWEDEHMSFYQLRKPEYEEDEPEKLGIFPKPDDETVERSNFEGNEMENGIEEGYYPEERPISGRSNHDGLSVEDDLSSRRDTGVTEEDVSRFAMHLDHRPSMDDEYSTENDATIVQDYVPTYPVDGPAPSYWNNFQVVTNDPESRVEDPESLRAVENVSQSSVATENDVSPTTDIASAQQYYWLTNPTEDQLQEQNQTAEMDPEGGNAVAEEHSGAAMTLSSESSPQEAMSIEDQWKAYYAALAAQQNGEWQSQTTDSQHQSTDQQAQYQDYYPGYSWDAQTGQWIANTTTQEQNNYGTYDYSAYYTQNSAQVPNWNQNAYPPTDPEIPSEDEDGGTPGIPATPSYSNASLQPTYGQPPVQPSVPSTNGTGNQAKPGLMSRFTGFFKSSSPDSAGQTGSKTSGADQPVASAAQQPALIPTYPQNAWSNTPGNPVVNPSQAAYYQPNSYYQQYGQQNAYGANGTNQYAGAGAYWNPQDPQQQYASHSSGSVPFPAQIEQLNAEVAPGHAVPPLY